MSNYRKIVIYLEDEEVISMYTEVDLQKIDMTLQTPNMLSQVLADLEAAGIYVRHIYASKVD